MARKKKRAPKRCRQPFHILCKPVGALCNLRCEHCFYLEKTELYPEEKDFRMSDDVLEAFTRKYIEAQPDGVQEIQFAWQGGEPTLLGVDFFRRALELQRKYARPEMVVANAIQTNGTLIDDEWAEFLQKNDFLVGISFDGPKELHDHYRVDASGEGSFDRAMAGLDALRRHDVQYNTLTCVQAHNADHGAEVYEFLKDEAGAGFMQFIPIVGVFPDGSLTDWTPTGAQFGRFMCDVFDRWVKNDVGETFVQHFDVLLGIVAGYPPSLCVHSQVCGRAVAIEHNGDIYSCDHFVFEENRLGNVMDDTVPYMIDGEQQTRFGLGKRDGLSKKCRECDYLPLCNGGCLQHRHAVTAEGEKVNVFCDGYRMLAKHTLPVLRGMAQAIRSGRPARDWMRVMASGPDGPPRGRTP